MYSRLPSNSGWYSSLSLLSTDTRHGPYWQSSWSWKSAKHSRWMKCCTLLESGDPTQLVGAAGSWGQSPSSGSSSLNLRLSQSYRSRIHHAACLSSPHLESTQVPWGPSPCQICWTVPRSPTTCTACDPQSTLHPSQLRPLSLSAGRLSNCNSSLLPLNLFLHLCQQGPAAMPVSSVWKGRGTGQDLALCSVVHHP